MCHIDNIKLKFITSNFLPQGYDNYRKKTFLTLKIPSYVNVRRKNQKGRRHWAVYYTSPQSFIITFLRSFRKCLKRLAV